MFLLISNPTFATDEYFPKGMLGDFVQSWYSEQLTALEEPVLYKGIEDRNKQVFRFTWLRTFHHPISIRLEINTDNTGILYTKMTSGAEGYEPGKIQIHETKQISKDDVQKFLDLVRLESFWELPTKIKLINPDGTVSIGLDGAQWILEGSTKDNYHVVDRWSPKNGSFKKICLYLLELSELKVIEIY